MRVTAVRETRHRANVGAEAASWRGLDRLRCKCLMRQRSRPDEFSSDF